MRTLTFCLAIYVCTAGLSVAQESKPAAHTKARSDVQESYVVQVTAYQVNGLKDPAQSVDEIVAMLTNPNSEPKSESIETIRFSTLSGLESMVQFGQTISVPTGKTVSSRGTTMTQTQDVQIGTNVRVFATPQEGKVAVKIDYDSSRLQGGGDADDSPSDIATTQVSSMLLLEFGKPTLIGGITSNTSTFVLLTVTK